MGLNFKSEMRNIKRVRDGHTHAAWIVHIRRGKEHTKTFSDMTYSGKDEALSAAKLYRDEQELKRLYMDKIEFSNILKSTNKSGVTGVCYREVTGTRGQTYRYWIAQWSFGGKVKSKIFRVAEHGMDGARELAEAARRDDERAYHNTKSNLQTPWRDCIVQKVVVPLPSEM